MFHPTMKPALKGTGANVPKQVHFWDDDQRAVSQSDSDDREPPPPDPCGLARLLPKVEPTYWPQENTGDAIPPVGQQQLDLAHRTWIYVRSAEMHQGCFPQWRDVPFAADMGGHITAQNFKRTKYTKSVIQAVFNPGPLQLVSKFTLHIGFFRRPRWRYTPLFTRPYAYIYIAGTSVLSEQPISDTARLSLPYAVATRLLVDDSPELRQQYGKTMSMATALSHTGKSGEFEYAFRFYVTYDADLEFCSPLMAEAAAMWTMPKQIEVPPLMSVPTVVNIAGVRLTMWIPCPITGVTLDMILHAAVSTAIARKLTNVVNILLTAGRDVIAYVYDQFDRCSVVTHDAPRGDPIPFANQILAPTSVERTLMKAKKYQPFRRALIIFQLHRLRRTSRIRKRRRRRPVFRVRLRGYRRRIRRLLSRRPIMAVGKSAVAINFSATRGAAPARIIQRSQAKYGLGVQCAPPSLISTLRCGHNMTHPLIIQQTVPVCTPPIDILRLYYPVNLVNRRRCERHLDCVYQITHKNAHEFGINFVNGDINASYKPRRRENPAKPTPRPYKRPVLNLRRKRKRKPGPPKSLQRVKVVNVFRCIWARMHTSIHKVSAARIKWYLKRVRREKARKKRRTSVKYHRLPPSIRLHTHHRRKRVHGFARKKNGLPSISWQRLRAAFGDTDFSFRHPPGRSTMHRRLDEFMIDERARLHTGQSIRITLLFVKRDPPVLEDPPLVKHESMPPEYRGERLVINRTNYGLQQNVANVANFALHTAKIYRIIHPPTAVEEFRPKQVVRIIRTRFHKQASRTIERARARQLARARARARKYPRAPPPVRPPSDISDRKRQIWKKPRKTGRTERKPGKYPVPVREYPLLLRSEIRWRSLFQHRNPMIYRHGRWPAPEKDIERKVRGKWYRFKHPGPVRSRMKMPKCFSVQLPMHRLAASPIGARPRTYPRRRMSTVPIRLWQMKHKITPLDLETYEVSTFWRIVMDAIRPRTRSGMDFAAQRKVAPLKKSKRPLADMRIARLPILAPDFSLVPGISSIERVPVIALARRCARQTPRRKRDGYCIRESHYWPGIPVQEVLCLVGTRLAMNRFLLGYKPRPPPFKKDVGMHLLLEYLMDRYTGNRNFDLTETTRIVTKPILAWIHESSPLITEDLVYRFNSIHHGRGRYGASRFFESIDVAARFMEIKEIRRKKKRQLHPCPENSEDTAYTYADYLYSVSPYYQQLLIQPPRALITVSRNFYLRSRFTDAYETDYPPRLLVGVTTPQRLYWPAKRSEKIEVMRGVAAQHSGRIVHAAFNRPISAPSIRALGKLPRKKKKVRFS